MIARDGRRPGRRLPSEPELVRRLGVARGTIREAFKLLEQEGVIEVIHGSGRYVAGGAAVQVDTPITAFQSVSEALHRHGYEVRTRVVTLDRDRPTPAERAALRLPRGEDVVRLERVRECDGRPLVVSFEAFPAAILGADRLCEEAFGESLCAWLERRGRRVVSSAADIRAALPDEVPGGNAASCAWTLISERCVDAAGAPVLLSRNYFRGDCVAWKLVRRAA